MKPQLPQAVKVCLWSYDTDKMDFSIPDDRFRIIINILNRGNMEAVEWLWKNFSEKEIADTIQDSLESEWNKPSLNLWSLIYNTVPLKKSRFAQL
jgi:hypothetical protein